MAGSDGGGGLGNVLTTAGLLVAPNSTNALLKLRDQNIARQQLLSTDSAKATLVGGYDPKTGIDWDTGRSGMSPDEMTSLMAKADPDSALKMLQTRTVMAPMLNDPSLSNSQKTALLIGGPEAMKAYAMRQFPAYKDQYATGDNMGVVDLASNGGPKQVMTGNPTVINGWKNGQAQPFLSQFGQGSPTPFGGPGPLANPPLSELGKLMHDMSAAPQASFTGSQSPQRGPGQGAVPGIPAANGAPPNATQKIINAALSDAGKTAEQKAADTKTAELQAEHDAKLPYDALGAAGPLTNHLQDLARMRDLATQLKNHPGLSGITGIQGAAPNIPGSSASNAQALLDSLGGNTLTDVYNSARALSSTGGGFGRLTETEIPIFKGIYSSLDKKQDTGTFKNSLQNIIDTADQTEANLKGTYKQQYGQDYQAPVQNQAIVAAKAAISKGADPAKVRARLIQNGVDPTGL